MVDDDDDDSVFLTSCYMDLKGSGQMSWMGYIFTSLLFDSCTFRHLKASGGWRLNWEVLCLCTAFVGGAQDTMLAFRAVIIWIILRLRIIHDLSTNVKPHPSLPQPLHLQPSQL